MLKVKELKKLEEQGFKKEELIYDEGIDIIYTTEGTIINSKDNSIMMGNDENQFALDIYRLTKSNLIEEVN